MNGSLRNRALKSFGVVFGSQLTNQIISFISSIALARLLTPEDFGLMAMAYVFTGIAGLFADMGLGAAVIQKENLTEKHLCSVFWFNLALGTALFLILFLLSPAIANLYNEEALVAVLRYISTIFIITSIAIVPRAIFSKQVNFTPGSVAQLSALLISIATAITMSYMGFGVIALIAQQITYHSTSTIVVLLFNRWLPRYGFNWESLKELFSFSSYIFFDQILKHIAKTLDFFLLGRFMGAAPLGQYEKAKAMMIFPLNSMSHSFSAVMFPTFSEIQNDVERIRRIYLKTINAVSFLTFPTMLGLFSVSDSFMEGVLGPQWIESAIYLKIMCFAGLTISIVTLSGSIYMALGKAKLNFYIGLIFKPISILSLLIGMYFGPIGLAIGYVAAAWINGSIYLFFTLRLIDLPFTHFFKSLRLSLINAILMTVCLFLVSTLLSINSPLILLSVKVLLGGLIYTFLSVLFKHKIYLMTKQIITRKIVGLKI